MEHMHVSRFFDMLNRSRKIYGSMLEPVCRKWDLTRNEMDVLLFLYNNPDYDRAADIVAHRGMTKSHVSLSVTGLVERGMLERHFSSEDRRTAHLRLTGEGLLPAREAWDAQKAFFERIYEGIPEEALRLWNSMYEKIHDNITKISRDQEES